MLKTSEPSVCIEALGLYKDFSRRHRHASTFRLLTSFLGSENEADTLHALSEVDLRIDAGEVVGIVGNNGAGKTTLLKTIAGLYLPTRGRLRVQGDVTFLAGLGVGMVGDLPVRDNLFLYGTICGLHRRRLRELFDEIISWAELTQFVSAPLRTLSTGMKGRLAFSIARHVDADIVLLDEAFSAGDVRFRQKCNDFFAHRGRNRQTLLVATHGLEFVRNYCTRSLWMDSGHSRAYGDVEEVLREYKNASA